MILAGGVVHAACIAFVLGAELALGVGAWGASLAAAMALGLFRPSEVDGDIQIAVGGLGTHFRFTLDAVAADITVS